MLSIVVFIFSCHCGRTHQHIYLEAKGVKCLSFSFSVYLYEEKLDFEMVVDIEVSGLVFVVSDKSGLKSSKYKEQFS